MSSYQSPIKQNRIKDEVDVIIMFGKSRRNCLVCPYESIERKKKVHVMLDRMTYKNDEMFYVRKKICSFLIIKQTFFPRSTIGVINQRREI